jgi:hypothetical protein
MGLFRQQHGPGQVIGLRQFAWLLFLLLPTVVAAQDSPPSACTCSDIPAIQDRIQKLNGAKAMVAKVLSEAPADAPAKQETWAETQTLIASYIQAMQMQNLTVSSDTSLFNGAADPFCDAQPNAPSGCMAEDYAVHQKVHEQSCQAGHWAFQTPWLATTMLQEEITALQAEIDFLQKHLQCTPAKSVPQVSALVPAAACPAFQLNVQTLTVSALAAGGLSEQSQLSINGGNGANVPIVVNDDGSFQGSGSGSEGGSAGTSVGAQNRMTTIPTSMINMQASGVIQPGDCSTQPCQPDVMHLTLSGNSSRGGAATLQFDLPAYVGGQAQRTLLAMGALNSNMVVTLLQGDNGAPALGEGSSVLYSLSQCKAANSTPANNNSLGLAIPGLESGVPPANGVKPGFAQAPPGNVKVAVNESIRMSDSTPPPAPHLLVMVSEPIAASDTTQQPAPHLAVNVNESIQMSDAQSPLLAPAVITITETIHVSDNPVPPAMISVNESIHVLDAGAPTVTTPKNPRQEVGTPKSH